MNITIIIIIFQHILLAYIFCLIFLKVQKDDLIPDLLVLPPGTDLHNHPLVTDGAMEI